MAHSIRFAKMQGIGNDFIAFNQKSLENHDLLGLVPRLCDRHFGVGADGLLLIGPSPDPVCAFEFAMLNPDGTPDMCGNGLRCAAVFAYREKLIALDTKAYCVSTISGVHQCECISLSADMSSAQVRIDLGIPTFEREQIPVSDNVQIDLNHSIYFEIDGIAIKLIPVNTGSTHCVVFIDHPHDTNTFMSISTQLETHPAFPERTSIMWAHQVAPNDFSLRIWERGAGETLGCGTGACAVAAAAIKSGRSKFGEDINIRSKGGTLTINWRNETSPIMMTGPAIWVYEGNITI